MFLLCNPSPSRSTLILSPSPPLPISPCLSQTRMQRLKWRETHKSSNPEYHRQRTPDTKTASASTPPLPTLSKTKKKKEKNENEGWPRKALNTTVFTTPAPSGASLSYLPLKKWSLGVGALTLTFKKQCHTQHTPPTHRAAEAAAAKNERVLGKCWTPYTTTLWHESTSPMPSFSFLPSGDICKISSLPNDIFYDLYLRHLVFSATFHFLSIFFMFFNFFNILFI